MDKISKLIKNFGFNLKKRIIYDSNNTYIINEINNPGKIYCLKTFINDELNSKLINKEYSLPRKINSDRIIKNYHLLSDDNYFYMISKLYSYDIISFINNYNNINFNENEAKYLIKEMALCVKDCHINNIVHLDLKPENFVVELLNNQIKISLIDFGFSELIESSDLIYSYNIKGTEKYISPELKLGYYNKCSDIYSFGKMTEKILKGIDINISKESNEFINNCIDNDYYSRPMIDEVLNSEWLKI